jgi:hypothetical protein
MLTKRKFRTSLVCMGLIAMTGLLYAGFAPFAGLDPATRLQQEPLQLDVPVIRQSLGTSCGEAAIAMAYNYAYPQTPISEGQAITYATDQGYFTADLPPYTSPANMVKIAEHYAGKVSSGTVANANQGLRLLFQNLQNGTPVIIDVLSNFKDPRSEAHFIVVTGLSVNPDRDNEILVHYNDPLTGTRASAAWSGAEGVWNAWQNNGDPGGPGWWLALPLG